jgi:hypothetical protein
MQPRRRSASDRRTARARRCRSPSPRAIAATGCRQGLRGRDVRDTRCSRGRRPAELPLHALGRRLHLGLVGDVAGEGAPGPTSMTATVSPCSKAAAIAAPIPRMPPRRRRRSPGRRLEELEHDPVGVANVQTSRPSSLPCRSARGRRTARPRRPRAADAVVDVVHEHAHVRDPDVRRLVRGRAPAARGTRRARCASPVPPAGPSARGHGWRVIAERYPLPSPARARPPAPPRRDRRRASGRGSRR